MLTSMRKNHKFLSVFLWLVIIAFLATIFVVWGMGEKQSSSSYVATIGDEIITNNDYQTAYEQAREQLRQIFGPEAEALIRESGDFGFNVVNSLVNSHLLLMEAKRIGLPISNAEVKDIILNLPYFMRDGVFDLELYKQMLQSQGYTPAHFENEIKQERLLTKMRQLIDSSVAVTDREIEEEYKFQNAKIAGSYFTVTSDAYKSDDIDDEEFNAFYKNNIEKYRKASQIKLKYIKFDIKNFPFEYRPTQDEVRARYTASIAQYTTPETVDISQITVRVSDWRDNAYAADAKARIESALSELRAGGNFKKVAEKYSDSLGETGDGFIGTLPRPEGELAGVYALVFSLKNNEISEVVESATGYQIFKVTNHQIKKVTPFEKVEQAIAAEMYDDAKRAKYRSYIYNIHRDISNAGNITAYLQKIDASNSYIGQLGEIGLIAEDDPKAFFQADQELKDHLFALGKTEVSPLMEFNGSTYVYEVSDKIVSYLPELKDVRHAVEVAYRLDHAFKSCQKEVDEAIQAQTVTTSEFEVIAKRFKARVGVIPAFSRLEVGPKLEWADDLASILFQHNVGEVIKYPAPQGGRLYVVRIDAVIPPNMADIAVSKEAISSLLLGQKRDDALNGLLIELRKQHKVVINPNFSFK